MRCYYVLVHGKLDWATESILSDEFGATKPTGFYCHRYVLALDKGEARATALRRVQRNFENQFSWLRDGLATVHLEAEEVDSAQMRKLLKPDNRGHTFYTEE